MGVGPCVRVSKSVSHGLGLGIAYEESKLRGHGSSTAGGHTGNGHGPRAPGAGLQGAGRGPGHRPRRAVTYGASRSVCPGVRGSKFLDPLSEAHAFACRTGRGQYNPNLSPLPRGGGGGRQARGPAARTYDGGSRFAEAMTAITWRQGGLAAQPRWGVGGAGRNCGALGEARPLLQRGNSSCISGTAMREPSRGLSAHPDLEAQSGKSIPVTPPGLTSAFRLPENTPGLIEFLVVLP